MSSLRVLVLLPLGTADAARYRCVAVSPGPTYMDEGRAPPLLTASATALPDPGPLGEVIAVVPLQALSWHRVTWPRQQPLRGPRAAAVLAGLLEEQLLDEPASLHFALEPDAADAAARGEALWVGVCDRAWLQSHLDALEAAGRPARRLIPEVAPIPRTETDSPSWTLRAVEGSEGPALIVQGRGFSGGAARLPLESSWVEAVLGGAPLPDDARLYAEPGVLEAAERTLQRRAELQTPAQAWLAAAQSPWDLAQFDFRSMGRARWARLAAAWRALAHEPQWRPVRWGLALLALVPFVGLEVWAAQERRMLAALDAQARALVTHTAPEIRPLVDPLRQFERAVQWRRATTGQPGPADLEPLLGTLGSLGASVQRIELDAARVLLVGIEPKAAAALDARLRPLGWRARRVEADRVQVEPADEAATTGGPR